MSEIGFCGDDCGQCPRYIATINNNPASLKKVTDIWIRVGWRNEGTPYEEIICYGCSSMKSCHYEKIRNCTKSKSIKNCGECVNYPCEEILQVFQKTESYANLCKENCSQEDYKSLNDAFFLKRKKLNEINRKYISSLKKG